MLIIQFHRILKTFDMSHMCQMPYLYKRRNYLVYIMVATKKLASHLQCNTTFSKFRAWWIMRLINGERNLQRMSAQKIDAIFSATLVA